MKIQETKYIEVFDKIFTGLLEKLSPNLCDSFIQN